MTDSDKSESNFMGRLLTRFQRNKRDPLDSGSSTPEPELARFGSLRLTPRRIVQSYTWRQSTAPLSRVVRVDVRRVHTRTWLIIMLFCAVSGWGTMVWTGIEDFKTIGIAGSAISFFFYLASRRTRLTVSLEDGSDMTVAIRNKHFVRASRFANIVCRVCTLWEPPRDREASLPDIPMRGRSRAAIEIVDEDDPVSEDDPRQSKKDEHVTDSLERDLAAQITGRDDDEDHPRIMMPETPDTEDETTVNPLVGEPLETSA